MEKISRTNSRSSLSLAGLAVVVALGLAGCGQSPDEDNFSIDPSANPAAADAADPDSLVSIDPETEVEVEGLGGKCLYANWGKKMCIKGAYYACGCKNPTRDFKNKKAWICTWVKFNPKYWPKETNACKAQADRPH